MSTPEMSSQQVAIRKTKKTPDLFLLATVFILLGIGLVMVFSASSVEAMVLFKDPYYFLNKQIIWSVLGLVAMFFISKIDYWHYPKWAFPLFALTFLLLIAVLIPGVGRNINGARRWIGFGSLVFQPSEVAKISVVLLFATTLTGTRFRPERFIRGILPHIGILAIVFALILKEPDMGTAMALGGTAFTMMFVAGGKKRYLGGLIAAAIPIVAVMIMAAPYRRQRFLAFLDPWKHPLGSGYHIIQSLYALGSGGLFGVGLGRSSLKYFYLPEQHTDFIFAILGEELGFIGAATVVILFFFFAWRGFKIAIAAPDRFSSILAVGVTMMIILQATINIAVVTASMPITGIPLPFISYGGSSLVFALAGIGALLNISKHSTTP